MNIEKISADSLKSIIQENGCSCIVDVREHIELATEKVDGATHAPLTQLDQHLDKIDKQSQVYVLCKTGNRAQKAAETMKTQGYEKVCIIEGGIEAWKAAGMDTIKGKTKIWSLERQVRFSAGLLVMLGVVASLGLDPRAIYFSAAIAFGLMFSALTNTCGMGMVLAKMPWNQQ